MTLAAAHPSVVAPVSFRHLFHLTDRIGLFEHADHTRPRRDHGYCVDDVARGLVVVAREAHPSPELTRLATTYLHFVLDAQGPDGGFRNRRTVLGDWTDEPSVEDCWGRALWALGTAVARAPGLADWQALGAFTAGAQLRSPWHRSMAFAALGAAEVLTISPLHVPARTLLGDAARLIAGPTPGMGIAPTIVPGWRWPEPRLRYANAVLAETLIAAGSLLGVWKWLTDGLGMLAWLLETETSAGHLSPTPAHGWALGEPRPAFDQQPIEVAALADACSRAFDVTADPRWQAAVQLCADWFDGANDAGTSLRDPLSGGGCDGLHEFGRNENQGAESTIALISTMQQAQRVGVAGL
ncbi:glycosyltransferase [Pedococcus sp. P5_B7]